MNNNNEAIITSLLDTDTYKFSMQQVVYHQYPNAKVSYVFTCRNKDVKLGFLKDEVIEQIGYLGWLNFRKEELDYLATLGFLKPSYIKFLSTFKLNPSDVDVENVNGDLTIKITEKSWLDTILYEVYVLSIVNELYFRKTTSFKSLQQEAQIRLDNKISVIQGYPQLKISEFGTRRRYSKAWQEHVLKTLIERVPNNIVGTSNVYLAMKLGIKAHGTMAHEYISAHMGLVDHISQAQKRALHVWLQEYDSNLGTALTDTFTTKAFFGDFGKVLTNGFSGLRHDSGDPIIFGRSAIAHYKSMGIDPKTKSLIFSDGLTIRKAIEIWKAFAGDIGIAFGIGTHLTNDMSEYLDALNIVMKLVWCNGVDCVKLSDNVTKAIGKKEAVEAMKNVYGISQ